MKLWRCVATIETYIASEEKPSEFWHWVNAGGSYLEAYDNTVVSTTNYGLAISGGTNNNPISVTSPEALMRTGTAVT